LATARWFYIFGFDIISDLRDQWEYDLYLDAEEEEKEKRKQNRMLKRTATQAPNK
jgi:hypothetical protein